MKRNILTLFIFSISSLVATQAVSYEGNFTTTFEPSRNQEGYSVTFDGKWEAGTFFKEPTKNIRFNWDFISGGDTVSMQFIPYGKSEMVEVEVPRQIARRSKPIDVSLKGRLSSLIGGSLSFDGGAISKASNYNTTGSPDWNEVFKQNNRYLSAERSQEIMRSDFTLDFSYYTHEVTFDLSDIKLWYNKNQREKYEKAACYNVTDLYTQLADLSSKYKARLQKMIDLCKIPERVTLARINREIAYLQKMKFSAKNLTESQNSSLNSDLKVFIRTIQVRLKDINNTELSLSEIEKLYHVDKRSEERIILAHKQAEKKNKKKLNDLTFYSQSGFSSVLELLRNSDVVTRRINALRSNRWTRNAELNGSIVSIEWKLQSKREDTVTTYSASFDLCNTFYKETLLGATYRPSLEVRPMVQFDGGPLTREFIFLELSAEELKEVYYEIQLQCNKIKFPQYYK
ncbi:MAG: hypothetical protein KAG61_02340 [Bacteriovoracaceae bacterium]|nr:hypothetical protein [Bacteriovoracaceae bacterium]